MRKQELVTEVSRRTGLLQKDSDKIVSAAMDAIQEALSRGESVTLSGFGSFKVVHRKPRRGRNLQTGASLTIPGGQAPVFRAGSGLRAAVRGR